MNTCKKVQQKLTCFLYNELDKFSTAEVQAHISLCKKCKQELLDLQRLHQRIPQKPYLKVTEATVTPFRNLAFSRLEKQAEKHTSLLPFIRKPAMQFAFSLALLSIGFFLGQHNLFFKGQTQTSLRQMMTAGQIIRIDHSIIRPMLWSVDDVRIDFIDKTVDIQYNTHNDIHMRGSIHQPEIQEILCFAMLNDENPAVRLHAVKAIKLIADGEGPINLKVISSLEQLLLGEQNAGIKLLALRVLKSMPLTEQIKNIFIDELLYDKNTAIRIEAFEGLTIKGDLEPELVSILKSVKSDSSRYFQFQTELLLKNPQNKTSQKREELL